MLIYRFSLVIFLFFSSFLRADAKLYQKQESDFFDKKTNISHFGISKQEQIDALKALNKAYNQKDDNTFYCVNALGQKQRAGHISYENGVLHIAFRGTATYADIVTDLYALGTSYEEVGGKVHKGMYHHFQRILQENGDDGLTALLKQKLKEISSSTTILFSGHSMGATMALLAAESFRAGSLKEKTDLRFCPTSLKLLQVSGPASFSREVRNHFQTYWGAKSLSIERLYDPVSWWPTSDWWAGAAVKVNVKPVAPWFDIGKNHCLSSYLEEALQGKFSLRKFLKGLLA